MRVWLSNIRGDMSQSRAAEIVGISQSYYSMVECGDRTPSVPLAKRIAEIFDFNWINFFE